MEIEAQSGSDPRIRSVAEVLLEVMFLFNQETKEYFVQPLLYALVLCKEITPDSSIKAIATARASYCQCCYNQIKGGPA